MENIVITGGLGSGGSFLAEWIIENHPEVKIWIPARWHSTSVLTNIERIKEKVIIREVDLNDLGSIIRFLKECMPIKIFNMAATANVHVAFKTPLSVLQNNVASTANLLEAVREVCPDAIFQQCSTSEVIGDVLTIPITEDHPLNPCNVYAVSKLTTEKLCYTYWRAWKIRVIITRAFCYWNPRRRDLFASSFARQIALIEYGKKSILHHGNLLSVRAGIDVRDMVEAYWIASEKCDYGTPYNLGTNEGKTVGEILNILISKSTVPIATLEDESLLRKTDITNQIPDVTKFYNKTGWKPKIGLDESMEWLLDYYRKEN